MLRIHPQSRRQRFEPVVITGMGLITANGADRESAWRASRSGVCGVRDVSAFQHIPGHLKIAGAVRVQPEYEGQLKVMQLARIAAAEAMQDARVDLEAVDRDRFACAVSAHIGDIAWWNRKLAPESCYAQAVFRGGQWLPNSACWDLATRYELRGPRFSHSTACASGLIDILTAVRSIQDGQCDIALAGSSEAIDPLFAAGFQRMRVLASHDDPQQACRPFDRHRCGFVMGEGAGMFVVERLGHALARRAKIYAEVVAGKMMADAHHVTGLDIDSDSLARLIRDTLRAADLQACDVGYVNAHGTGTEQNDILESRGIRRAFGAAANDVCVSSLKAMLGHLVNASGSVELALTVLGMRDGFAPPTLNLTDPDPECDLDCLPLIGRSNRFQHALKLSLAFGGHLVAAAVRRWNDAATGFAYPDPEPLRRAA